MAASKNEFINMRMAEEYYMEIPKHVRDNIEIKSIDDTLPEYKTDEVLKDLYRQYAKISDKIRIRKFEIKDLINKNK